MQFSNALSSFQSDFNDALSLEFVTTSESRSFATRWNKGT